MGAIAVSVGAPFLRSDFFLGSEKWGVRLNEVAYCSGIKYFNLADDGSRRIVDDDPAIAQILQEGMSRCRRRLPPQHFLGRLGAKFTTYADMTVSPLLDEIAVPDSSTLPGTSSKSLSGAAPAELMPSSLWG